MRVLVIGGTGFIGPNVVRILTAQGNEKLFQPVRLDLEYRFEHSSQLSFRKALPAEPNEIRLR